MNNETERELKLLVDEDTFHAILRTYSFSDPWKQTNTYYDTKDRNLKKRKSAMRIRRIGDQRIFTLKIRTDAITHIELEKEIFVDTIQDIQDEEILSWFQTYDIPMNVEEIISFTTIRQVYETPEAEICADITMYQNHTDYEIEYEYKIDHDGERVFNTMLKPFEIEYKKNCPSKIARAL